MSYIINYNDKFYPEADNDIRSYCTFLGKYVDINGRKLDLGVFIKKDEILDATVYGYKNGQVQYTSGVVSEDWLNETGNYDWKREVYDRLLKYEVCKAMTNS